MRDMAAYAYSVALFVATVVVIGMGLIGTLIVVIGAILKIVGLA